MPQKHNSLTHRGPTLLKAALFMLLLLQGNTVLAQSSSNPKLSGGGISLGEVLILIAGIVVIVLVAWFFGAGQSKQTDHEVHSHPRKHYDHPNDPHFRKLKKKTS